MSDTITLQSFIFIESVLIHVLINYQSIEHIYTIDIKKVANQLTHTMHVKDIYVNDTFIDKLTKWYQ